MSPTSVDIAVATVASRQSGCVSRTQALAAGASVDAIKRRCRSGAWTVVAPGLYLLGGHEPRYAQRLWIAILAAGPRAVGSHDTSIYLHNVEGVGREPVVLTIPHPGHQRVAVDAVIHQTCDPWPLPTTTRRGVAVTTLERAFVDMAATTRLVRLSEMMEDAVAARKTTFGRIEACRASVDRPGKRGLIGLKAALEVFAEGPPVSRSVLERELHKLVERAGLPPLLRQYPYPGATSVEGCADGAWPFAKQIIETDGRRWHERKRQMKADRERDVAAQRVGWSVLRLMHEHVIGDPEWTIGVLRDVYRERMARAS